MRKTTAQRGHIRLNIDHQVVIMRCVFIKVTLLAYVSFAIEADVVLLVLWVGQTRKDDWVLLRIGPRVGKERI